MRDGGGGSKARQALVAIGVLALVTVPLAIWGASGSSDGDDLVVDVKARGPRAPVEVIVAFRDAATAGAARPQGHVVVECRDVAGERVLSQPARWPLETDGDADAPHAHLSATPEQAGRVSGCALLGLDRAYEGRVR